MKIRMKDYQLINLFNVVVIFVINGMCPKDAYHDVSSLDILAQKYLRYQHHRDSFFLKFATWYCFIGFETQKKTPAILPVSVDFEEKWKLILNEAQKKLAEKLLVESVEN